MNESLFQRQLFLSDEEKQNGFWVQDDVHLAHALSPLFASYQITAMTEGTSKAFSNLKMPIAQFVGKYADGRFYQNVVPFDGDMETRLGEHKQLMQSLFPRIKQRLDEAVEQVLMPYYRKLDDLRQKKLTLSEAKQQVEDLFDFYKLAWQLHFEIVMPRGPLGIVLEELYGALTEEKETTRVYELLTGVMNKSLETDKELCALASIVRASSILTGMFRQYSGTELVEALASAEEGRSFMEAVSAFLQQYGYRTINSHEFADQTWVENPPYVLSLINGYVQKDYDFSTEFASVIAEREAKVSELLARMPDVEAKQAFQQLYQWALDSWGLDEDHHFYIDAMLPAKARLFLLSVGDVLVGEGAISDREDLFFLFYDELVEQLEHPQQIKSLIEQRKQQHEENKPKKAAPFYGKPPEGPGDPMLDRIFGMKPAEVNQEEKTFKGYAASQGVYKGQVKIIGDPHEFSKLKQGDVLVCRTTTPPWTVLFGIAGAIVTDAGGILSHAGTVAREYKVPAVVGTKVATSMLKDGDVVTVDGSTGVVTINEQI